MAISATKQDVETPRRGPKVRALEGGSGATAVANSMADEKPAALLLHFHGGPYPQPNSKGRPTAPQNKQ